MFRKTLLATCVALLPLIASPARAVETFVSAPFTIHSDAETFTFDFSSSNFNTLDATDLLVGVRVDWKVTPGPGASGIANFIGDLTIAGENTGTGMNINMDLSGPSVAGGANFADTGLVFSPAVLGELFGNSPRKLVGSITGVPLSSATAFADLFTAGGAIEAKLTLDIIPLGNSGGGGGEVPEPASLILWTAISGGCLLRKRFAA